MLSRIFDRNNAAAETPAEGTSSAQGSLLDLMNYNPVADPMAAQAVDAPQTAPAGNADNAGNADKVAQASDSTSAPVKRSGSLLDDFGVIEAEQRQQIANTQRAHKVKQFEIEQALATEQERVVIAPPPMNDSSSQNGYAHQLDFLADELAVLKMKVNGAGPNPANTVSQLPTTEDFHRPVSAGTGLGSALALFQYLFRCMMRFKSGAAIPAFRRQTPAPGPTGDLYSSYDHKASPANQTNRP